MKVGGNQSRDVRHVHHQRRADFVGDLAKRRVLHRAGIGARARDNHLGLVLARERADFVEVDQFGVLANAVGQRVVEFAGETHFGSVREMAAVRERHAQNRVARLQVRHEDGHVGLRAGVRLHVGVLGAEEALEPVDRERFGNVHPLASAVIPAPRIALGVLVGHHARHRFANGAARVVLRRDELEVLFLPALLARDRGEDFRVVGFDVAAREHIHIRAGPSASARR